MKNLRFIFLVICSLCICQMSPSLAAYTPDASATLLVQDDLEMASLDQWRVFSNNADGELALSTTGHDSNTSIKVTGREHYSTAIGRQVSSITLGDVLEVSAWVYQDVVDQADIQVSLLTEMTLADSSTAQHRETVRAITASRGQWKKVIGRVVVDYRDTLESSYIVFHSTWRTKKNPFDLYVDDITIKKVGTITIDQEYDLDAYYNNQFTLGATIHNETFQATTLKRQMLQQHFTSVTEEGAFKPGGFLSNENRGTLDFTKADKILQTCIDAGMRMRGHTLVWNAATPDWLFREGFQDDGAYLSEADMEARLEWYIKGVMEHFNAFEDSQGRPIVYTWDVVNEMIDPSTSDKIKRGNWYSTVGPDIIEKSFEYARKYARSDVTLFYNDYDNPYRYNTILNILQPIKAAGNIDGIGIQGHWWSVNPSHSSVENAIRSYGNAGYEVHITELDINMASFDETLLSMPIEMAEEQAERYRRLFDVFSKYDCVTNVTFWGTTDNQSWLNFQAADHGDNISLVRLAFPVLFDSMFQPKRAVEVITRKQADDVVLSATDADEYSGVEVFPASVGYCDNGDWIKFADVDLGNGHSYFTANLAVHNDYDGGSYSVYLDDPTGSLIGTMEVTGTGGWQNYQDQTMAINGYGGVHDIYIVFNRDGVGNFRSFSFINKPGTYQAEHFDESNGFQYGNLGINQCDTDKWVMFKDVDLSQVNKMEARYGVPYNNYPVEIRVDGVNGQLVGTLQTVNSGGWDSTAYHVTSTNLQQLSGTHDVYILFKRQGSGNYDWFRFYND